VKATTLLAWAALVGVVVALWTWPPTARFMVGRLQNNVGYAYQHGIGIARDVPTAIDWYTRSAAHGDTAAATNLGFLYQSGDGAPPNPRLAARWYAQAASGGSAEAANNLAALYMDGSLGQADLVTARTWLLRARALATGELATTIQGNLERAEHAMSSAEIARSDAAGHADPSANDPGAAGHGGGAKSARQP
jgi:hypothetical protein